MLAVVIIQAFKIVNASATFSDEVQLDTKKEEKEGNIETERTMWRWISYALFI